LHDVAIQRLPVLFAIDRAGLNAADGLTHHGIYDVAFLSDIPELDIWHPLTTGTLAARLTALLRDGLKRPTAVRYHAGGDDVRSVAYVNSPKTTSLYEGVYADFDAQQPPQTLIVCYGRITACALAAAEQIGGNVGVIAVEHLRPCQALAQMLAEMIGKGTRKIVLCEEGIRSGGFAMTLAAEIGSHFEDKVAPKIRIVAIDNDCVTPDAKKGESIFDAAGVGTADIVRAICE
jgi:1-deoxy-D-xylulose-5-phosphate synthase